MKIGYQGSSGAFSHIAARFFDINAEHIGYTDFTLLFEALHHDEVDYITVPIDNSYAGRVADPHRLLTKYDFYFHGEYIQDIRHQLLVIPGTKISDIAEIYSHEQAIMQSRQTISKLPGINKNVKFIPYWDTAMAAEMVQKANRNNIAAIASDLACEIYNLENIAKNVNDANDNRTHFILMSKSQVKQEREYGKDFITSIIARIYNKPGSLLEVLSIFYKFGIDIVKLESYIPCGNSLNADFFISIFGHQLDANISSALNELTHKIPSIRVFGSYQADHSRIR